MKDTLAEINTLKKKLNKHYKTIQDSYIEICNKYGLYHYVSLSGFADCNCRSKDSKYHATLTYDNSSIILNVNDGRHATFNSFEKFEKQLAAWQNEENKHE